MQEKEIYLTIVKLLYHWNEIIMSLSGYTFRFCLTHQQLEVVWFSRVFFFVTLPSQQPKLKRNTFSTLSIHSPTKGTHTLHLMVPIIINM